MYSAISNEAYKFFYKTQLKKLPPCFEFNPNNIKHNSQEFSLLGGTNEGHIIRIVASKDAKCSEYKIIIITNQLNLYCKHTDSINGSFSFIPKDELVPINYINIIIDMFKTLITKQFVSDNYTNLVRVISDLLDKIGKNIINFDIDKYKIACQYKIIKKHYKVIHDKYIKIKLFMKKSQDSQTAFKFKHQSNPVNDNSFHPFDSSSFEVKSNPESNTFNSNTFNSNTFNPESNTFNPESNTFNSNTFNSNTFNPESNTFNPESNTFNPESNTFNPESNTFNSNTFNSKSNTFNPDTFNPKSNTFNFFK